MPYLFDILETNDIPFEEKERAADEILTKFIDMGSHDSRVSFAICIVTILILFALTKNPTAFYILVKKLVKAIREGRISKAVGRYIFRRLKKEGFPVDSELIDLVNPKS